MWDPTGTLSSARDKFPITRTWKAPPVRLPFRSTDMARWELQPDREISWAPSFVLRYSVYVSSTFITLIQHRLSSSSTTSISTPITTVVQVNKNMRDLPTLFFSPASGKHGAVSGNSYEILAKLVCTCQLGVLRVQQPEVKDDA